MAKRKVTPASQRNTGSGETSTALIFFLVFSILLNLGLGIATYFGFQHDDNLKAANKDLENRVKDMTDQRDWYQFQALSYRAYMGQFNPKDAGTLADRRAQFNRGALGAKAPDFAEASTLIVTNLEKDHKLS